MIDLEVVGPAGLEPATLCLEGRCSIQLSYEPKSFQRNTPEFDFTLLPAYRRIVFAFTWLVALAGGEDGELLDFVGGDAFELSARGVDIAAAGLTDEAGHRAAQDVLETENAFG